jgi:class 3 adenylate cyclase
LTPLQGRVLVVDDDEGNRALLARRLQREGLQATVAASGEEALRLLTGGAFDLVLLDMVMPGLDGGQVLARLKADPTTAAVPVIMISSLDQDESVARCIEAGAEDYIAKPFNLVFLRARIAACLEKKRLREQEAQFLAQIQAEKEHTDELLHIILPRDVVAELKAFGEVRPRRFEHVGVLFCDIVGFAAYSDRRPPEEILAHLQTLVEAFEQIVARHGLEKIKTIGDAFMAVAGLPAPLECPALHCVRAGLDMIAAARTHAAGWQIRVGVNVGPVVAGIVGRMKYQFDVWGDTVNTAARVEQAGEPGAVCLPAAAWATVAGEFTGHPRGRVPLKGKGEVELVLVRPEAG